VILAKFTYFLPTFKMKKFLSSICIFSFVILLSACSSELSPAPTEGEQNMADMMGISVEELRNQTPEEHMKAMQEMMK
jgi:hypothetical protein